MTPDELPDPKDEADAVRILAEHLSGQGHTVTSHKGRWVRKKRRWVDSSSKRPKSREVDEHG